MLRIRVRATVKYVVLVRARLGLVVRLWSIVVKWGQRDEQCESERGLQYDRSWEC